MNFLNVANNAVKSWGVCLLLGAGLTSVSFAQETTPSPTSLASPSWIDSRELVVTPAQKNETGNQYQLGDRIKLMVEIPNDLVGQNNHFNLSLPEGQSKLDEQGWYLDPETLWVPNSLQFIVAPIKTGKLTLPTLMIKSDQKEVIARTRALTLDILGPEAPKTPPQLIDPQDIDLATKYKVLLLVTFLALVAAVFYFYRRWKTQRRIQAPIQPPAVPIEADHAIALRALEQLYRSYPYSRAHLKPIAYGISEILKTFFSARFHVDAIESTSDEMIALLRGEALPSDTLREIASLFNDLDLIKFTKNEDTHQFNEEHYIAFKVKAQSLIQKWAHAEVKNP